MYVCMYIHVPIYCMCICTHVSVYCFFLSPFAGMLLDALSANNESLETDVVVDDDLCFEQKVEK